MDIKKQLVHHVLTGFMQISDDLVILNYASEDAYDTIDRINWAFPNCHFGITVTIDENKKWVVKIVETPNIHKLTESFLSRYVARLSDLSIGQGCYQLRYDTSELKDQAANLLTKCLNGLNFFVQNNKDSLTVRVL